MRFICMVVGIVAGMVICVAVAMDTAEMVKSQNITYYLEKSECIYENKADCHEAIVTIYTEKPIDVYPE